MKTIVIDQALFFKNEKLTSFHNVFSSVSNFWSIYKWHRFNATLPISSPKPVFLVECATKRRPMNFVTWWNLSQKVKSKLVEILAFLDISFSCIWGHLRRHNRGGAWNRRPKGSTCPPFLTLLPCMTVFSDEGSGIIDNYRTATWWFCSLVDTRSLPLLGTRPQESITKK